MASASSSLTNRVHHRCYVCRNLAFKEFSSQVGMLDTNLDSLRRTSSGGCTQCTLLHVICLSFWAERFRRGLNSGAQIRIQDGRLLVGIQAHDQEELSGLYELLEVTVSKKREESIRVRTPPYGVTGSFAAASQISEWLTRCAVLCHKDLHSGALGCSQPIAPPLPTRTLEIMSQTEVRLYSNDGNEPRHAHYACLSHCWGDNTFIQTRSSNLEAYKRNVPWIDVPQTFRDAIDVTWRLGIRYLWIDSLCIVQDDLEDWRHEGSKMASIYSQSYVTLAATAASHPGCGLFTNAPSRQIAKHLRISNDSQDDFDIFVTSISQDVLQHDFNWPLLKRAWVFQERFLSPRVVHFTSAEMVWECKTMTTCECQWASWDDASKSSHLGSMSRSWEDTPNDRGFTAHDNWHRIVEQYMALEMSFETDIFPALQGVAQLMQSRRQTEYYAGLWGDSLLLDLTWMSGMFCKVAAYRAPSWSWASCTQEVWYKYGDGGRPYRVKALVQSVTTVPVGLDPLGAISYGELCLQGRCIQGSDLVPRTKFNGWSSDIDNGHFDHDDSQIVLIEILSGESDEDSEWRKVCIALEPTAESKTTYRRIELVELEQRFWPSFDAKAEMRTLTII